VTVVPVVPVVSVAIVPAVLFTVDCDVAVDGSVVLSVVPVVNGDRYCRNNCHCNYWHH
jgi:hypothetical protein